MGRAIDHSVILGDVTRGMVSSSGRNPRGAGPITMMGATSMALGAGGR
jgi:hypothetical protein